MIGDSHVLQILLAEDNPADVLLVRQALREASVDCALHVMQDGEQATDFIERLDSDGKERPLDMLLLDLYLPKCDGVEILKKLRSTKHYWQTPVIVVTSSGAPSDYQIAQKHAALHYFRKPSTLSGFMHLGAIVREVVDGKKPNECIGREVSGTA